MSKTIDALRRCFLKCISLQYYLSGEHKASRIAASNEGTCPQRLRTGNVASRLAGEYRSSLFNVFFWSVLLLHHVLSLLRLVALSV
jgi:hypothetical protein